MVRYGVRFISCSDFRCATHIWRSFLALGIGLVYTLVSVQHFYFLILSLPVLYLLSGLAVKCTVCYRFELGVDQECTEFGVD